jgi:hypothetical protein
LANSDSPSLARHGIVALLVGAASLAALSACDLPFSIGQPTTRALQYGVVDSLDKARSFRITGSYTESADPSSTPSTSASGTRTNFAGGKVDIDLQLTRPDSQHVVISAADTKLEAIVLGNDAYFRGNQFLSQHMGTDPLSRSLVKAAGNGWWKGSAGHVPRLPDLTDGASFKATFLGTAATQRSDHVSVDGHDAVELSGPRADVFVAADSPYHLLRVHLKNGVVVDGIRDGDLRFGDYDLDFQIAAPPNVIDFSNLSTLPPVYTVVSVDTSGCTSPCAVSALLKNLGGGSGAQAPSTVTFTLTATATGQVLGSCQAQVKPDVGYNATTAVACTIGNLNSQQVNAATVTATADNPGRA